MKVIAPPVNEAAADAIAERLRDTMKKRGITSVQLARMAGIKTSFLYDLLRKKSHNPSIIRLARVAEALNIPLSYLAGNKSVAKHFDMQDKIVSIPYLAAINARSSDASPLHFHSAWLNEYFGNHENLRWYKIETDAMKPTLQEGDTVLVDITKKTPSSSGIFIIREKNARAVRRMEYVEELKEVRLLCDNPAYLPDVRPLASIDVGGGIVWASRFIAP